MLASVGTQLGWLAAAPQGGAGGNLLSSGLIAAGVMMLIWLLLRKQWRRHRQPDKTPLEHMSQISSSARERGREELAGADLVQLSRRVLAQIDARSAHLEALIADADERIDQLRRLGAGGRDGVGAAGAEPGPVGNGRPRQTATQDPVTRGVYELADRGLAPVEIARELDQHLGAVELILALRPK
jgi:hypothetical protein